MICCIRAPLGLDAEYIAGSEHIAGEDDEPRIRGEADVGLQPIVVVTHVDQVLGVKYTWLPEVGLVDSHNWEHLRVEQFDPLAVRGLGHLARIAAVTSEEFLIRS